MEHLVAFKSMGRLQARLYYNYLLSTNIHSGAPLYGRLLALPTNIRLGWKGLPGRNALAYYEKA
jgi:hypothetical protein